MQGDTEWGPCFTPKDTAGSFDNAEYNREVLTDNCTWVSPDRDSFDNTAHNAAKADKDFACIVP